MANELVDEAAPEQLTPGNIDLANRPRVQNPDGSVSTVRSMSFEEDGKEILVPTVVGGRVVSDAEAIANYKKTGQHLGIFSTSAAATAFAQSLHESEAAKLTTPATPATPAGAPLSDLEKFYDDGIAQRQTAKEVGVRRSLIEGGGVSPELAAESRRLSLTYGDPPAVIARNIDKYRVKARADQAGPILAKAPALGAWIAKDPANAAVAHDDLPTLSGFERTIDIGRNLLGAAGAGIAMFSEGVWGAARAASEAVDVLKSLPDRAAAFARGSAMNQTALTAGASTPSEISNFTAMTAAVATHLAERMRGPTAPKAGLIEKAVYSGVESITQNLPGLLMGGFVGETGLLAAMGVTTAGSAYQQARAEGLDVMPALGFSSVQGIVEVGTEMLPAHLLFKDLAESAPFRKLLAHQFMSEMPTEQIATVLQDLNEWVMLPSNKERPFSDYLKERPSAAAATAIAVLTTVGVQSGIVHGVAKLYAQATFLHDVGDLAKESKTIQRAPGAAEDYLTTAMKDGSLEHVYAPIDTFTRYWQGQGQDPAAIAAALTGDPEAYPTAIEQHDADLVIPSARYITQLAGTEHHAFFENELRVSPELQNKREQDDYAKEQAAIETAPAGPPTKREQAQTAVADLLINAGYLPRDAHANAQLVAAAFVTMAEAAGEDPLQVLRDRGLEVIRPDLDAARRAAGETKTAPDAPAATAQIFTGKSAFSEGQYGASRGTLGDDNREQLLVAPDGSFYWGPYAVEFKAGTAGATGAEQVVREGGGTPAFFATSKEARAAAEAIGTTPAAPVLTKDRTEEAAAATPEQQIAQLKDDLRAATRAAEVDSLTGVANRAALDKALPTAEADPHTHVVLFDANNFGQVNKLAGHEAGDAMLKQMSAAITQAATEFGVGGRVFRRGGDEFVVLAPAGVADQVRARAEELFGQQPIESPSWFMSETEPPVVSLTGTSANTFREADATLQGTKTTAKADALTARQATPESPLESLQRTGVATAPGLRVRVLPTTGPEGQFELEVTEKGARTFEGKFSLEEAQRAGAAKLAALIAHPTPAIVTPQVEALLGMGGLAPFASTEAQRLPKTGKGKTPQRPAPGITVDQMTEAELKALVATGDESGQAGLELARRTAAENFDKVTAGVLSLDPDAEVRVSATGDAIAILSTKGATPETRGKGDVERFIRDNSRRLLKGFPEVGVDPTGQWQVIAKTKDAWNAIVDSLPDAASPEALAAEHAAAEAAGESVSDAAPVATIAETPAAVPVTALKKGEAPAWTAVGTNDVGATLFEDQRGVRSLVMPSGDRVTENVKLVPTRAGMTYEVGPRSPRWSVTEALPTPAAAPIVEEVGTPDETPAGGTDNLAGGRPTGAGDAGGSVGRPGDERAASLAGEQPNPREPIQKKPRPPRGPRKRGAPAGVPDVRGGAPVAGAGDAAGASAGANAASHVDTADMAASADVAAAEARGEAPRRFHIDDTASLTEGGWAAKLADNIAAIRLLKVLQREGRMATDAEQAVLARYIGWGHTDLKDVVEFELGESTLSNRDPRKQKARDELESLLTREELQELGESTPNAHYSFADLPRAMWTAVQRLGFRGGSILEPAVGTGHFLGTMPGEILAHKQTRVSAVEKEPIAAAITRQLFQDTHVQNSPLQDANLPANHYDLQISNVPFGRIGIFDPEFHTSPERRLLNKVHNYYFGKSQDIARPGGIVAFVTSRYTMDARNDSIRTFLAKGFNLLGAVRLPDQAFKATAGTDVVTDIIFLQKRAADEPASGHAWTQSPLHPTLSETNHKGDVTNPIHQNEYFQAHPENVLGTQNLSGSMARTNISQYNVQGTLTLDQLVAGLTKALPADVYKPSTAAPRKLAEVISRDIKQGSFQVDGGKLFLYDKGTLAPSELTGRPLDVAKRFVPMRDAYQGVLDTMVKGGTDAELKKAQAALLGKYKAFVAEFGLVSDPKNRKIIEHDPNAGRIVALERVEIVRKKGKQAEIKLLGYADIFSKRTYQPVIEATTADSPAAALTQSLAWKGEVNLPYMAALTGQTETDLVAALGAEVYRDPVTHAYQPKAEYLSGDVTTKLAQAQVAAAEDASYKDNVTALAAVLPTQFTAEDFPAPFGATWVPPAVYASFIQAEMRGSAANVTLVNGETRVKWYVEGGYGKHEFLPEGANAMEWAANALNGELPVIYSGTGEERMRDEPATEAYRESLKQLRERWAEWWPTDPSASDTLVKIYNGMFNRDAAYVADGSHLVLAGSNPDIKLRFWQKNVVWRALQTGNTLIAHAVGAGKTYAMIGIAGEWKRLGLANKPLVVVPNHLTQQWQDDFTKLYPASRVLVPTKEDFQPANRKRLMAQIANNDWDAVVMAQSHFLRVSVKVETLKAFIKEQEDQMLADGAQQLNMSTEEFQSLVTDYGAGEKAAVQALSARNAPRSVKDIARGILTLRARLQKRLNQAGKDAPVTFEELGVDGLLVDEAHLYKNLYFSTSMNGVAGLKGSDSDRAMDMFLKVRQINQQSKGRNVVFATGTPVSNTLSELYTMFRYLAQPTLDRLGMSGFDSWAHGNAEASAEMEKSAGTGYKERTRLRSWSNLRELSAQFRKFADVLTTDDLIASGAVTIPKRKGGSPTVIALDPHPDMPAFMQSIDNRIEALKSGKVDPKDDNHLLVTTHAAMAAIDMRLVNPTAEADPNGRIPTAAVEIAKRYRATTEATATTVAKGVQIVFLDIGIPDGKSMPPLPKSVITGGPAVALAEPTMSAEEADPDLVDPEAEADAAMADILAAGHARDLYSDLRQRLIAQGIRDDEIAYVHQAKTPYELGQLYAAVNDGRIRVLLASTSKGATGMNVQQKLVAIHHLDVPWRPADVEQRNGRIFRQGNQNTDAEEVRYVTKQSFDEYRWAVLATKQQGIVALMKGTLTSMDDVDPGQLDFEVASALANGDPRALDLLNKERQIKALRTRYQAYTRKINAAKRTIAAGGDAIETLTARGAALGATLAEAQTWAETRQLRLVDRPAGYSGEAAREQTYDMGDTESRKAVQARIESLMSAEPYRDSVDVGSAGPYRLVLNKTSGTEFTVVDGQVTQKSGNGYFLSVKAQVGSELLVIGSTKTWQSGAEFPEFARSLDAHLDPKKLGKLAEQTADTLRQWKESIAADTAIAAKPFLQLDQLHQAEAELATLRGSLAGKPTTAADGTPESPAAPAAGGIPETAPATKAGMLAVLDVATQVKAPKSKTWTVLSPGALDRTKATLQNEGESDVKWHVEHIAQRGDVVSLLARTYSVATGQPQTKVGDTYQFRVPAGFTLPKSFDQPLKGTPEPDARRGNVTFDTHPQTGRPRTTITLPPNADLSTFLHESAHVFLEVFGDMVDKVRARDPQTLTHGQNRLLADYDALLHEFKIPDRAHIGTPEHEQFATQFERYLMQGDAPSVELQSTFDRFRGWLLDIYRSLKNIGTPLSAEVKGIFDRMLASEAEIDAAEHDTPPLFTTADDAGMTASEFARYRTAAEEQHRVTREQLDRQITKEVNAERSAERLAQRTAIAGEVTTALQAEPVYRALEAMRTGMTPEGASLLEGSEPVPLQLARAPLVAEFGEDRVNALPAGIVSTTEGGTTADLVASVFGFGSGDELLQAVAAAPPLADAIAARTDARMQTEHRSMLTDGTLRDRVRAAAANTDHDALIRAEVKALWRKHDKAERDYERRFLEAETKLRIAYAQGYKQVEIDKLAKTVADLKATARGGAAAVRRALPSPKTLQAAAEARVNRTKIQDLRPTLFWTAARQAARKALALAATQDIPGAIAAKTAELTNLANHRATVSALTDSKARQAWVLDHDTTKARGRTGLAGADYLDQWDGLLDRFEFKKVSRKVLDRRENLKAWIDAQEKAGLPVQLPAIVLNDALKVNYQTLTVEQFVGVTDGMKSLIHLAELKLGLLRKGEQRSFEAIRDEIADSIRAKTPERKIPIEFRQSGEKWRSLEGAIASHANLSTLAFQLDGNEYNGPVWEHIVRPANEAGAAEEVRNQKAATDYHAILEKHYPGRDVFHFGDQVFIPAINASLSKEARLAIAMHMGNESGKARVLSDPSLNWSTTQLAAVLDTLERNDWAFVQDHWDFLNTFWPEIAAKSQRLTGLPPEKVEAVPVETKFGTFPGGYSPIVYDWRKSSEVGQTQAVSEAKLVVAGAAIRATTKRGHEETRLAHVELPLRLDMTATSQHLSQVIHDLTHHEFLIDATRLLRDKSVAAAIHATRGPVMQQKLGRILTDIATGDRAPGGRPTLIETGAAWLRTRTQVAGLAWNVWTSLQQPLGIFNGMERVGIGWVAKGAGMWARDAVSMEKTVAMVFDKSDMMRARYGTATQDLHDLRETLSAEGGWFDKAVRTVTADKVTQRTILDSYMELIHFAQMFADKPTWLGEYLKQMDADPTDEPRAIAAADQAVLDSQGGGQIKDLAEVQRGGQVAKLFMTFASYSTMILNSTARAAGQTNFRSPSSALTFAGHLAMLYVIPAFFTEALRCGVGRAHCDEVPQFLARVGGQSLSTALNGILYLREAVADVNLLLGQDVGAHGYEGPAGTRIFQVLAELSTQIHQGHVDKGLERAAFAFSGLLFRYPAAQVQRSLDGWMAMQEGRTKNPAALIVGAPPKSEGRVSGGGLE